MRNVLQTESPRLGGKDDVRLPEVFSEGQKAGRALAKGAPDARPRITFLKRRSKAIDGTEHGNQEEPDAKTKNHNHNRLNEVYERVNRIRHLALIEL